MLVSIEIISERIEEANVNLKEHLSEEEFRNYEIKSKEDICQEVETGIYFTGLNFDHDIDFFTDSKILKGNIHEQWERVGVCDHYLQVVDRHPELHLETKKFVLSLTSIRKNEEPERDGWRWEKWGEYIGNQNPQCDYIYDEPEIEEVFVYEIYEIE